MFVLITSGIGCIALINHTITQYWNCEPEVRCHKKFYHKLAGTFIPTLPRVLGILFECKI
jgi:hypothetical protein